MVACGFVASLVCKFVACDAAVASLCYALQIMSLVASLVAVVARSLESRIRSRIVGKEALKAYNCV